MTPFHCSRFVLGALLVATAFVAGACRTQAAASAPSADVPRGILVVGHGEASGEPDVARVDVGVQVRAATVEQATEQANARMREVIDAVTKQGVARKDIQTRNVSVHEERTWEPPPRPEATPEGEGPGKLPQTHYVAQNMLELTVRDLDELGEILGAVTASGANQIHGIRLEIDDPDALEKRALEDAVADARAQAEQLAALGGVELGRIVSMQTTTVGRPMPFAVAMDARMEKAESVPVERGEIEVQQQVQVLFELAGR